MTLLSISWSSHLADTECVDCLLSVWILDLGSDEVRSPYFVSSIVLLHINRHENEQELRMGMCPLLTTDRKNRSSIIF